MKKLLKSIRPKAFVKNFYRGNRLYLAFEGRSSLEMNRIVNYRLDNDCCNDTSIKFPETLKSDVKNSSSSFSRNTL